jgi:hypothetical protein
VNRNSAAAARNLGETRRMGLREFRDKRGVQWKVWNVTPDSLDKRTTAEDYMKEWQDGWLCFECAEHRRRLAAYPPTWEQLPDDELEALLERSQAVRRRSGAAEVSGEFGKVPESGAAASPPADAERSRAKERPGAGRMTPAAGVDTTRQRILTDSRGRTFVAGLYRIPSRESTSEGKIASSPGTVLRFISGSIVLDLEDYPDDWDRYTDSQLTALLDRAQPVDAESIGDSLPLRRQTDLPG